MIINKLIRLVLISTLLTSCSFAPKNADVIVLLKEAEDTLSISIIDSYNIIKKYRAVDKGDTLFIEIISVYSPSADDFSPPIRIPINRGIKVVKLQNDLVFDVDSIPYSGWVKPLK